MTRYVFNDVSLEWLQQNGFEEEEIDSLQDILNKIESHKKEDGDRLLHLPKGVSGKIAAMITLLESITDSVDRPICFEESGLIDIPDEAKDYFEEDMELEDLERISGKLKKVRFARRYSDPRRRGTMKQNDKFGF